MGDKGFNWYSTDMQRHIALKTLHEKDDSLAYWLTRPVEERIAAVEALRQAYYAQVPHVQQGFQRVCVFTQRTRR